MASGSVRVRATGGDLQDERGAVGALVEFLPVHRGLCVVHAVLRPRGADLHGDLRFGLPRVCVRSGSVHVRSGFVRQVYFFCGSQDARLGVDRRVDGCLLRRSDEEAVPSRPGAVSAREHERCCSCRERLFRQGIVSESV